MPQDTVRVEDQERLDKPDFLALQSLVYQYVNEAVGGLVGNASGLLSSLAWTKTDDGVTWSLNLDKLVLVHSTTAARRIEAHGVNPAVNVGAAWDAIVHNFDPADTGHINHPIDYTSARSDEQAAPGTKPYIWARPYEVDSDVDTRRQWSVASGTETPVAVATRVRQRLEFAIGVDAPAVGILGRTWIAIARVWAWSGVDDSIADLRGLSAWDDVNLHTFLQDPGDAEDYAATNASMAHPLARLSESGNNRDDGTLDDWPTGDERSAGLLHHLTLLRSRLQRHISGGSTDPGATVAAPWWRAPLISLNGAKSRLDTNLGFILTNTNSMLDNKNALTRNVSLCAGVISFHPAALYGVPYNVDGWFIRQGWGIESVTAEAVAAEGFALRFKDSLIAGREAWYISAVTATPVWTSGHITNSQRANLQPQLINQPDGDPGAWLGPAALSSYAGAAVGLPAGQYGVKLLTSLEKVVGGALSIAAPAPGALVKELAWSVNVVISKFKTGDVGA